MELPLIEETVINGVTLLGDPGRPGGVTFAFTGRTGGVSERPYSSLNLGTHVGDDATAVAENRRRALDALGAASAASRLVAPKQVHGDAVVLVDDASPAAVARAQEEAAAGADAVVCTVPGVPVMLVFADCVPVVLAAPGAFAVVHSGWKGTYAHVAAKALAVLCEAGGVAPGDVNAYIGPHILGCDYEVSEELLSRFESEFGSIVRAGERHLSLAAAIEETLVNAGVEPCRVFNVGISTPAATDRFFSYRAEHGTCGRHGAVAWMAPIGS